MPAPVGRRISGLESPDSTVFLHKDTPVEQQLRSIDNHYHLEMVAENASQIESHLRQARIQQHEEAVTHLRALAEITNRQDQEIDLHKQANSLLHDLTETAAETRDAITAQTGVLQAGFQQIAQLMLLQQKELVQIADILRGPRETEVFELLRAADKALKQGMRSSGRYQSSAYADATRLLNEVLANPIGSCNYVAWFQTGWLKWKYTAQISEAAEAFFQAARLSAPEANLYHAISLQHLAYMQYLQGSYQEAYDSIREATRVMPDNHDIRYDAARYAAKLGHEAEAMSLLEKCIDQQPQTIDMMLSEKDFLQ